MKAWELLDSREKWTQGSLARDEDGYAVDRPEDPLAAQWCLVGAMEKCYPDAVERVPLYDKIRIQINNWRLGRWNDHSTYEDVVKVLKELDI